MDASRGTTTYFTTAVAVAAGISIAFGVLYLFVAMRRPERRGRGLLFAGFAFAYAGASLTARAGFLSDSPDAYAASFRVSLVVASAAFALFGWYVRSYSSFGARWFLWALTGGWLALAVAIAVVPDSLLGDALGNETITLAWGETVRISGSEPVPGLALGALLQVILIGYVVTAGVVQFRRGDRVDALVLAVGVGWFALMLLLENLSTLGVVALPPAADFGFLGFVFALSFARVNESIEYQRALVASREDLEARVDRRTAELEAAQQALVDQASEAAAEAERVRISRDLHDAVSQLLFSINLLAGSLPRLWQSDVGAAERSTAELQRLARGALAEMRTLLRELRPHTIPQTDLTLLVDQLTQGVAARIDVPIEVTADLDEGLPPDVHVAVYRVCQEAIANVAKHADASRVAVRLAGGPDVVHLAITDDGVGFDAAAEPSGTMGLSTMAERAAAVGGRVDVLSQVGGGTVVSFEWERPGA